jgi:murein L,D-transpeptidase YcbB/YkuD
MALAQTSAPEASSASGEQAVTPSAPDRPAAASSDSGRQSATPSATDQQVATPSAPEQPAVAVDPIVAYVRQKLSQPPRSKGVDRRDWEALASTYAERNDPPLWVSGGQLSQRARTVMAEIAKADDWGLLAAAFELPQPPPGPASPEALGDAEITLGLGVLKYARYARGGRVDPAQISRNFDQKPSLRDPKLVMQEIAAATAPDAYLRSLHPKHVQFERLRQALLKARAAASQKSEAPDTPEVKLPDGPVLKSGMEHPQVALLRRRLGVAGEPGRENVFDDELEAAVKVFQKERGNAADGMVGARTRAVLNGEQRPSANSEIERLLVNMERWRWMPENLGDLYVWDNIPEFFMRVVKNGRMIHSAKIVAGKPDTQTPIFSADMRYIVFHPEWGVPDSIKVKEILPYLRPSDGFFGFGGTDTRILQRHNLKVSYNGRPVDASQVDWSSVDVRRFTFIQPAGPGNVLGVVKFRFPNKHDVYMHDTPQRELFDKQTRAYSHGCMRVQDPGRLAEILLAEDKGWSAAHVRGLLAEGYNNEVELTRRIPVHVTYFTAMVGDDGVLRTIPDPYGHDKRVAAALAGRPLPLERLETNAPDEPITEARRVRPRYREAYGPNNFFSGLFGN